MPKAKSRFSSNGAGPSAEMGRSARAPMAAPAKDTIKTTIASPQRWIPSVCWNRSNRREFNLCMPLKITVTLANAPGKINPPDMVFGSWIVPKCSGLGLELSPMASRRGSRNGNDLTGQDLPGEVRGQLKQPTRASSLRIAPSKETGGSLSGWDARIRSQRAGFAQPDSGLVCFR